VCVCVCDRLLQTFSVFPYCYCVTAQFLATDVDRTKLSNPISTRFFIAK